MDPIQIDKLPDESQLNIQVDAMAGLYRSTMTIHVPTIKFPKGELSIGLRGIYHHHFPAKAIRHAAEGPALQIYICNKMSWTAEDFDSIEWETYAIVLKELSDTI